MSNSLQAPGLLAFIHIEKTAGETMKWIMRSSFGLSHCDISPSIVFKPLTPRELIWIRRLYPSLRSIAGHPVTPYMDLESVCSPIDYFAFIRDPVKQCASYFQYLAVTLKRYSTADFETWIQTDWPRNMQTKRLCAQADTLKAIEIIHEKNIFIGLTERFNESILLLKTLRIPDLCLGYQKRNEASDNAVATTLLTDPRTRSLIEDAVQEDKKLYEWVKNNLYPQYIRAYIQQTGKPEVDISLLGGHHFRSSALFANRIYRNLVYKPFFGIYKRFSGYEQKTNQEQG